MMSWLRWPSDSHYSNGVGLFHYGLQNSPFHPPTSLCVYTRLCVSGCGGVCVPWHADRSPAVIRASTQFLTRSLVGLWVRIRGREGEKQCFKNGKGVLEFRELSSIRQCGFHLGSPVSSHLPETWLVASNWPWVWMCAHGALKWTGDPSRVSHVQCSWDRFQIHYDPWPGLRWMDTWSLY